MRTTKRENKSGTVRYLHLAHNEWDPVTGGAVPKVLFTFGREDELDRDAIRRLVASLSRLLEPGQAVEASAVPGLEFTGSVPFGGAYVPDHLWHRLKIDRIVSRTGQPKRARPRGSCAGVLVMYGGTVAEDGSTADVSPAPATRTPPGSSPRVRLVQTSVKKLVNNNSK